MEAATLKRQTGGPRRFLASRTGALTIAAVTAALAAIVLIAYLNNYKDDVRGGTVPTQVIIADRLIPKGTSGDAIATDRFFRPSTIAAEDAKAGFLTDAEGLAGKIATRDIYPGQQLTAADFKIGGDRLRGRLTGQQRAIAVSLDAARAVGNNVRGGDRVDIFASFGGGDAQAANTVRTLATDVLVLSAAADSGGTAEDAPVVVRLSDVLAAKVAYAQDNGKVWLALRPPAGARTSGPIAVTQGSLGGSR